MSITSQLPPISLAQASASLRALAQASGQTVEARVLSQNANGTTQVQIGRQVMSLALPEQQPVGATLTLSVQQSDGQLRLALVSVRPPGVPTTSVPASSTVPAASVQLSAAALASTPPPASPTIPQPSATNAAAAATQNAGAATPIPAPAPARVPPPVSPYGAAPMPNVSPPPVTTPQAAQSPPPPVVSLAGGASAAPPSPVLPASVPAYPAPGFAGQTSQPAPVQGQATTAMGAPAATPVASTPSQPAPAGVAPNPGANAGFAVRPSVPYAVAAPTVAVVPPAANAGSTATVLPPVGQTLASSMVGQHGPAPNPPGTPATAPAMTQAPVSSAQAASPQAALAQMVQQALPRQDSILGLTRALTAIAGKVALPEPVAKAAQQVLAARLPLDGGKLAGAAIKSAIQQSGLFQEAMLAAGQPAGGEVKGALLALRQGLGAWLGNQAPVAQVGSVPPPLRGQVPRARAGEGVPPDMPDDPLEAGKVLLERTEAALSRLRLHQNASLPDPNPARQDAQWSMDLPVIVAGQNQVLHMQIQRDAEQEAERSEERSWQVRFAINLAERGEVGAQISLRAKNTSVLLWADQTSTAASLAVAVEDLREELASVGLVPGAIVVRAGVPADEPVQPLGQAGHVVDATR